MPEFVNLHALYVLKVKQSIIHNYQINYHDICNDLLIIAPTANPDTIYK